MADRRRLPVSRGDPASAGACSRRRQHPRDGVRRTTVHLVRTLRTPQQMARLHVPTRRRLAPAWKAPWCLRLWTRSGDGSRASRDVPPALGWRRSLTCESARRALLMSLWGGLPVTVEPSPMCRWGRAASAEGAGSRVCGWCPQHDLSHIPRWRSDAAAAVRSRKPRWTGTGASSGPARSPWLRRRR